MLLNALILATVVIAAITLTLPRVRGSAAWRATTTPLASIIGSGFLILGPVLQSAYGGYAPLAMAGLCATAYLYGSAIRSNIASLEETGGVRLGLDQGLETAASWALAFAYIISVAYYLNLFGAFGVSLTPFNDRTSARLLTSATFLLVLAIGWTRGFRALERMEQISVGLKLAIIAGLLLGLVVFFLRAAVDHRLAAPPAHEQGWAAAALAFGLLVTVQGFETSRYLGAAYDADTRIRSMRIAQWVSSAIYLVYIALLTYDFASPERLGETAVIDMMAVVAPILPLLLVAAALAAQFSAAVADTAGSGGLFHELSLQKISEAQAYAGLVAVGLIMTWSLSVFETVSYASRAFAVYYGLQALIAARTAWREQMRLRGGLFAALAVLAAVIVLFGKPAEG